MSASCQQFQWFVLAAFLYMDTLPLIVNYIINDSSDSSVTSSMNDSSSIVESFPKVV